MQNLSLYDHSTMVAYLKVILATEPVRGESIQRCATGDASQLHVQWHYVRNLTLAMEVFTLTETGKHYNIKKDLLCNWMSALKIEVAYVNSIHLS